MLTKLTRRSELSPTLRSFDEMFSSMLKQFDPFYPFETPFESRSFGKMELEVMNDEIIAKLPLPGCKADDISVEIANDILTVHAYRKCYCKDDNCKDKLIRHERHCETFEESVKLPAAIDPKNTKAEYKHGILAVTMSKNPAEKNSVRSIKVN